MTEHDWEEPSFRFDGSRGNVWNCKVCGAVVIWNGKPPYSPIDNPYYDLWKNPVSSSLLGSQSRDCDIEQTRRLIES
jgi:transposase